MQQRQAGREQGHAEPVEAVGRLRLVALELDPGEDDADHADRHVDQEDPAPGDVVDQPAAEDRAEDRRDQHRHAEDAHHAAHPVGAGLLGHDRHDRGHDHAAADALEDAEGDQRVGAPGRRAEGGAEHEEGERGEVDALGAEAVGGPAGRRDHRGERQGVAGDDPLDRRQRGVEVDRQPVDRDVDDRRVEDRHDRPDHDDGRDHQGVAVERVGVCGRGCGVWLTHAVHRIKRSYAVSGRYAFPMASGIDSVWTRDEERAAGPQPLSRESIVAAAIEIADTEGLEAVSIRRLATKLERPPDESLLTHRAQGRPDRPDGRRGDGRLDPPRADTQRRLARRPPPDRPAHP